MLKPDTLTIHVARSMESETRVANIPVFRASTVLFDSLE